MRKSTSLVVLGTMIALAFALQPAKAQCVMAVTPPGGSAPILGEPGEDIHICLGRATRIEVSNERLHFAISNIDLRRKPWVRALLSECINKEWVRYRGTCICSVRVRLWLPRGAHQDFWLLPDYSQPAVREPGRYGRARLWVACPRLMDLLQIPWFGGTRAGAQARCSDIRPLLEAAETLRLTRLVELLGPYREERRESVLDLRGNRLGKRLASLVNPKPFLDYDPHPLVGAQNWMVTLVHAGRPAATLFWDPGHKHGLLYFSPEAAGGPVCAWETAGDEFRDILLSGKAADPVARKGTK